MPADIGGGESRLAHDSALWFCFRCRCFRSPSAADIVANPETAPADRVTRNTLLFIELRHSLITCRYRSDSVVLWSSIRFQLYVLRRRYMWARVGMASPSRGTSPVASLDWLVDAHVLFRKDVCVRLARIMVTPRQHNNQGESHLEEIILQIGGYNRTTCVSAVPWMAPFLPIA